MLPLNNLDSALEEVMGRQVKEGFIGNLLDLLDLHQGGRGRREIHPSFADSHKWALTIFDGFRLENFPIYSHSLKFKSKYSFMVLFISTNVKNG